MTLDAFGALPDGQPVARVTLRAHGMQVSILSFGARVQDLRLDGLSHPLVLGFPTLAPYLGEGIYFGPIVGRFANRIAQGKARIAGRDYQFDRNFLGKHLLHGGAQGMAGRNWRIIGHNDDHVTLGTRLPDGEMGFPGNLDLRLDYRILSGPRLRISVSARSDAPTLCNLAQHSYFNLDGSADIRGHRLEIPARDYTPVDAELIPTGAVLPVAGTPLDFRAPRGLDDPETLARLDHNFCIAGERQAAPVPAARLSAGGLVLEIASTEPGLQAYSGSYLRPGAVGIGGRAYGANAGIALESQLWPDAPNHAHFPSALLLPDETYRQETELRFHRPAPT